MTRRPFLTIGYLGTCGLTMLALAGPLNPDCYFPVRSGCDDGGFCLPGQTVCEEEWTKYEDNGCGHLAPLGQPSQAVCGELGSVLKRDCDLPHPGGNWISVGCKSGDLCCYTDSLNNVSFYEDVYVEQPGGNICCDQTAVP